MVRSQCWMVFAIVAGSGSYGCRGEDILPATAETAASQPGFAAEPDPAFVGEACTVALWGLTRSSSLQIEADDGIGSVTLELLTDDLGETSFTVTARAAGSVAIRLFEYESGGALVERERFTIGAILRSGCGDAVCRAAEDCRTCAADCGACSAGDVVGADSLLGVGKRVDAGFADDSGRVHGSGRPHGRKRDAGGSTEADAATGDAGVDAAPPSPVCDPAQTQLPFGNHNSGRACLGCHTGTSGAPFWALAGTLYDGANSSTTVSGATITVIDATGATFKLVSASNGNFYTADSTIQLPVSVYASKCPDLVQMSFAPSSGNCNACHVAGSRIHLP